MIDPAKYSNSLGFRFHDRFERTGHIADLEQVIPYDQQALEATSANHTDCVEFLINLWIEFLNWFERIGKMADLEQAIRYGQQALEATSASHLNHTESLNNLGV